MNLSTFVKIILFTGLLPFFSFKSKVEKKQSATSQYYFYHVR